MQQINSLNMYLFFQECTLSYGENCQYPCSQHCINNTCDRFDGSCPKDCDNDKSCKLGTCARWTPYKVIFKAHKYGVMTPYLTLANLFNWFIINMQFKRNQTFSKCTF